MSDTDHIPCPIEPGDTSGAPADNVPPRTEADARAKRILNCLGFCGRYMHFHGGGTSGKAPIICLIAKHGGTMSQQELSTYFHLKPGSLSEILSKCETAGFIERTRNPEDRRQLIIKLTEEGTAQAARDQAARIEFRDKAFAALSPDEQETLADMLEKVKATWEDFND